MGVISRVEGGRSRPGTARHRARRRNMTRKLRELAVVGATLAVLTAGNPALAQKPGGILKSYTIDSPASLSIHEEVTIYALRPAMGVFNNLVMYDQLVKQNSMAPIVPDLAWRCSWTKTRPRVTSNRNTGTSCTIAKPC